MEKGEKVVVLLEGLKRKGRDDGMLGRGLVVAQVAMRPPCWNSHDADRTRGSGLKGRAAGRRRREPWECTVGSGGEGR